MCDKGIIEENPDVMKLDYCITISRELQQEITDGLSKVLGVPVVFASPKPGEFPTERKYYGKNTIVLCTSLPDNYKTRIVDFSLTQMPGCCGILISHNVYVGKSFEGKGVNSFLQGIREKIAKENGYTSLMCTTTSENKAEVHILEKYGWSCVDKFVNKRTGNTVLTYTKKVNNAR